MSSTVLPSARSWWPELRFRRARQERYVGLDAARGLAVFGMFIAHAGHIGEWGTPQALLGFADGRSSILFATVAGVSLALLSGGRRTLAGDALRAARLGIVGRAIVLLFIGGILAMLPTQVAVILTSYAFWFLLALPALRWRASTLLLVALGLALAGGAVAAFLLKATEQVQFNDPTVAFAPDMLIASVYPALVWLAFVFAGMAIGRYGLDNKRALATFAVAGLVLFVAGAAPFIIQQRSLAPLFVSTAEKSHIYCFDAAQDALYLCTFDEQITNQEQLSETEVQRYWELREPKDKAAKVAADMLVTKVWTLDPHSGSPFEAISSGGLAIALIAGLVLLGRLRPMNWLLLPLITTGSMSLSAYSAHIVVLAYLPGDQQDPWYVVWLSLGVAGGTLLWWLVYSCGPLEQFTGAVADRLAGRPPARPGLGLAL